MLIAWRVAIIGTMADVSQILTRIDQGDPSAAEQLLPLVYDELRKLAAARLAHEKPGQTLQPTALVHEAYVRLVDNQSQQHFNSRGHFFAAAAEAMRRILVERARRKQRVRHGGEFRRIDLDEGCSLAEPIPEELLAVDEALERLERIDSARARLVKLRFFAGMTIPEAAAAMGISRATAERHWTFARTWLFAEISGDSACEQGSDCQ